MHVDGPVATPVKKVAGNPDYWSAYEFTNSDSVILVTQPGYIQLPRAEICPGRQYTIKNIIYPDDYCYIRCYDTAQEFDLIDKAKPYTLDPWHSIVVVSDGDANGDGIGHWYIVAKY